MNKGNERMMAIIAALRKWPRWAVISLTVGIVVILGISMIFLLPQSSQSTGDSSYLTSTGLALEVSLKLLVVVLLIVGLAIIVKHLQTKKQTIQPKQISVLETIHLTPHQSLHLVNFGDHKLLIGATDQTITVLSEEKNNPSEENKPTETPAPNLSFSDYLSRANSSIENQKDI